MKAPRHGTVLFIVLMLSARTLLAGSDFETFKTKYEKLIGDIAEEYAAQITDLNQRYSKALSNLKETAKKEGDQDKVEAVADELNRLEFGILEEESAGEDFPGLYNVQVSYRKQAASLEGEKDKKTFTLALQYNRGLEQLQKSLVTENKINEALRVQEERSKHRNSPEFKRALTASRGPAAEQSGSSQVQEAPVPAQSSPTQVAVKQETGLDITVRKGRTKKAVYCYDTKEQLRLSMSIRNKKVVEDFTGLRATFYAFSKDMSGARDGYKLVIKETFTFDLPRREIYKHECKPFSQIYVSKGSCRYGFKYAGYAAVICDETGNIIRTRATKASMLKKLDELEKMYTGQFLDF